MFIYYRYKSTVAKLISLQVQNCTKSQIVFACISLNIHPIKMFHIKVAVVNEMCMLHCVLVFCLRTLINFVLILL
jgi:hypothetical protein